MQLHRVDTIDQSEHAVNPTSTFFIVEFAGYETPS